MKKKGGAAALPPMTDTDAEDGHVRSGLAADKLGWYLRFQAVQKRLLSVPLGLHEAPRINQRR